MTESPGNSAEEPVAAPSAKSKSLFNWPFPLKFILIPLALIGTAISGVVVSGLSGPIHVLVDPVLQNISSAACSLTTPKSIPSPDKLTILVNRLSGDADGSQTARIINAFHGEGFNVIPTCEQMGYDSSRDLASQDSTNLQAGIGLLKKHGADLLIFGNVVKSDESLQIWYLNEYGGCDLTPTSVILKSGIVPGDFAKDVEARITGAAVGEITAACESSGSFRKTIDWATFEQRTIKVGWYIARSNGRLTADQIESLSIHYARALDLLYANTNRNEFFIQALKFDRELIAFNVDRSPLESAAAWNIYGQLFAVKYTSSHLATDEQEAADAFRHAISLSPTLASAHANLGDILRTQGKIQDGVDEYRIAASLKAREATTHASLCSALHDLGKYDEAAAECRAAVQLNPRNDDMQLSLGNMMSNLGKIDEAIADYRAAIKLNPRNALAHTELGVTLFNHQRIDEALSELRTAVSIDDTNIRARNNLSESLAIRKELDEAIRVSRGTIALDSKNDQAHGDLGGMLLAQGKFDEAIPEFRTAASLKPSVEAYHLPLGFALVTRHRFDEAVPELRTATTLTPNDSSAHLYLGIALKQQGYLDDAIPELRTATGLAPENALAHKHLGVGLYLKGDREAAVTDLEAAMRLEPTDPQTILWLHLAHAWSGIDDIDDIKKASDQFDRAKWPMPVVSYFLGQTDDGTLLESAAQGGMADQPDKICDANFFVGSLALVHRQQEKAIGFLQAARDKCAHDTSAWIGADLEIKRLNITTVGH